MIMSFEFQIWQHTKFSAQKEHILKQETQSDLVSFHHHVHGVSTLDVPAKKMQH